MSRAFKNLAASAAKAADSKKGEDITLLDVHKQSGLTEYLLLVNVNSESHLDAIETAISDLMEKAGVSLRHRDGTDTLWRVLDYGGLMVHLMHPKARDFYALDKLYHEAPRRSWE